MVSVTEPVFVLRPDLMPNVGLRLGLEDAPMKVEIDYNRSVDVKYQEGTVTMPPGLMISLSWGDRSDQAEEMPEDTVTVPVGRDVEASLTPKTGRLLCIDGLITDVDAWRLVPQIIGTALWQVALAIVTAEETETQEVEVDPASLGELTDRWAELIEAARSGKVVNMPSNPAERDRVLGIVMAQPGFMDRAVKVFDELMGGEPSTE